jgi:hypothetical protein
MNSFWEDKWLHDQYNQRNPGQTNHPDSQRQSQAMSRPPDPPARPKRPTIPDEKKRRQR